MRAIFWRRSQGLWHRLEVASAQRRTEWSLASVVAAFGLQAISLSAPLPDLSAPRRIDGGRDIPRPGINTHRRFSGSTPVPGGGARERARNIALAEKAAQKAAALRDAKEAA